VAKLPLNYNGNRIVSPNPIAEYCSPKNPKPSWISLRFAPNPARWLWKSAALPSPALPKEKICKLE
jgi:hypothetical protein